MKCITLYKRLARLPVPEVEVVAGSNGQHVVDGMEGQRGNNTTIVRLPTLTTTRLIPDANLSAQTAGGDEVLVGGVKDDTPGGAGVPVQGGDQLTRARIRDVDVVVTVC